jgi:eukaryotic-like serine/threonine-protein kinase
MALAPGVRLGSYEIIDLLGAGGMGEVYRALDSGLGREVAIKVLPQALALHPERLARFEREARLLASLSHPNIAVVHGLERSSDSYYLVMELVQGHTLAERLARGPLPMADALATMKQVAEGLEAAHERSIIHRDLKPANIMVTAKGIVKILDFGLAKATAEDSGLATESPTLGSSATVTGMVMGTAAYMSPEQARGDHVDRRTDIWAFGCVLFEALTGRRAFPGRTVSDTIAGVLREEPDWSSLTSSAPLRVERLVRRCLEKNTHQRLHDIADVRLEIDDVSREPLTAGSIAASQPASHRRALSSRMAWAIAAATAIVAIAAVIVAWRQPARGSAATIPLSRLMISIPPVQTLERSRSSPVALSPDGTLLVYAAAVGGGRTTLFMRPLNQLTANPLPATEGASTPFFSPDGRWLGFYADGMLKKVSVAGGVPLTICDAPPIWSASWGDRDTIVFATTLPSSGLWEVSANGGEPKPITKAGANEIQHGYPQLLAGETQVLFSVQRANGWQLALLTRDTGKWAVLGNGRIIGEGAQYVPTGHIVYAQSGGLIATPFDPATGDLNQPPAPLLERVEASRFGGAYFAVASTSGTLIYLPGGAAVASRTLLRLDRDGRVSPLVDARAAYEDPALSPDGRQLAVTIVSDTGSDIWIVDLARATRVRFTTGGTSAFPLWSTDSSKVAYQSTVPGSSNLFWKPLNGGEAQSFLSGASAASPSWPNAAANLLPGTLPTLSGGGPQFPSSWTSDQSVLAFHERKPSGDRDIWTVSEGSAPVPFLLTPFDERSPKFSPDGKWIAYVSDESGRNDVYVQPFPGPGAKWLVSTDGGVDPVWSHDGRELFFRRDDHMMVVSVVARAEFSASRPKPLFDIRFDAGANGPNFDVSRDGAWFVMPRNDLAAAPTELHVVFNWFSEIAGRARSSSVGETRDPRLMAGRVIDALRASVPFWFASVAAQAPTPSPQPAPPGADGAVRDTLQRYSAALERLDPEAVRKVQPGIPVATLAKAFKDMRELKVMIDAVRVLSMDGTTARVSCRVTQTLTPRAGAKQTTTLNRVMRLRRDSDVWVIDAFER